MTEVLYMILFVACPLVLWTLFLTGKGRIFWLITMSCCLLSVLVMEGVSKYVTGYTISNLFWKWSELHPMTAVVTLGLMWAGWTALMIHLGIRLIRKYILKK